MSKHYDTLETRTPAEREKALMQALPLQIAHAKQNAPFFKDWLKDVDPASVTSRAALAKLPVLRKSTLGEVQKKNPRGVWTALSRNPFHLSAGPRPPKRLSRRFWHPASGLSISAWRSMPWQPGFAARTPNGIWPICCCAPVSPSVRV